MESAAHRIYRIDNVLRVLVEHSSKPLLVKFMMLEKRGTIFDACVKELYKEVDYHVIEDLPRETSRQIQYLDAVIHVESDAPFEVSEHIPPRQLGALSRSLKPCTSKSAIELRCRCPNLKTITRHEIGRSDDQYNIRFEDGTDKGSVQWHTRHDLSYHRPIAHPGICTYLQTFWQVWACEHTAALIVLYDRQGDTRQADSEMKAVFMDTDQLDWRITEIQNGWLPFNLAELGDIAISRWDSKRHLSRISSTVEPFSLMHSTDSSGSRAEICLNSTCIPNHSPAGSYPWICRPSFD